MTSDSPLPERLRKPHSHYVDEAAAEYIEELEARIERMNAVIGRVRMQCRMSQKLYSEIDEVMTKEERR